MNPDDKKWEDTLKATKDFLKALENTTSEEELEKLRDRMDLLQAQYSNNPAYYALLQMKLLEKKALLHDKERS
jgi:hypothetical protein|nr:MAG TPA: hypothetical protein [Caudoviricetes sp.]